MKFHFNQSHITLHLTQKSWTALLCATETDRPVSRYSDQENITLGQTKGEYSDLGRVDNYFGTTFENSVT